MNRYFVTWSETQSCGTEVSADSAEHAIQLVKEGNYYFAETYGVETVEESYDVEEM